MRHAARQDSRRSKFRPCTPADRQHLAVISNQQNKSATGDALGVFLIGVPIASMSGGDHEAEIAFLKGRCGATKT
ncbi:hypothetical protein [Mesorhizobium sp. M0029]|uniref:hypothetical protein n=1 Tax=Mesorhizobium sp. M0029 TaxID=2956850 RepID=UPI0033351753